MGIHSTRVPENDGFYWLWDEFQQRTIVHLEQLQLSVRASEESAWRTEQIAQMTEIGQDSEQYTLLSPNKSWKSIDNFDYHWYGPLEIPEEIVA